MTLKLIPPNKDLQQQECSEGTYSPDQVPYKCDFSPGDWVIEINTAVDVPDWIEKAIVPQIAKSYAWVSGVEYKKTEVSGKKIKIHFHAAGGIVAIGVLIAIITGFVAITTVTLAQVGGGFAVGAGLAVLLIIVLALSKRGEQK